MKDFDKPITDYLFEYWQQLPEGSIWKDIAERTIYELRRENPFGNQAHKYYHPLATPIRNINTGRIYGSLKHAAAELNINYTTLRYQVNSECKKFGLEVIE